MKRITTTATTLDALREAIERIASVIAAPAGLLPSYGTTRDFAQPHLEVDSRGFHFVVVERGKEMERWTTRDPRELLFWVFDGVTSAMANQFELENRIDEQDCRRIAFSKKLELLAALDSDWASRAEKDQQAVLQRYPLDDFAGVRAALAKSLRDGGKTPDQAWEIACRQYPKP